jgi:uncharacterized protein YhbP (UPF0306 family)
MKPEELATTYLQEGRVMQLATSQDDYPRVNSLYYVASDDGRAVYWLSEATRRHSQTLSCNTHVGAAIVVKEDMPVIGLQLTGGASKIHDRDEQKRVLQKYNEKYDNAAAGLYDRMLAGTNKHCLYRLVIDQLELFDEVNFAHDIPMTIDLL